MGTIATVIRIKGLEQRFRTRPPRDFSARKKFIKANVPLATIKSASGLSEQELLELEEA